MKDGPERDWWTRYQRASITPGSVVAEFRAYMRTDVRAILSSIQVPTLVLSSTSGSGEDDPANGRFVERRIAGARNVELTPPPDELNWPHWYGRAPAILRETGAFVASIREEQEAFDRVLATVLFTDIVDSTAAAAVLGDAKWRPLIDEHDRMAKALVARYRGEYVHSTGDGILATFDGPARAVRCAQAIIEAARPLGVEIRAGLHTGEVERAEHGVAGVGVHIGARVGAMAGAGEVWVSSTVKDLTAGSGLTYEDAGEHQLKGVPDRWHLYRVARS
jgi:class 3 adenylate cyclase